MLKDYNKLKGESIDKKALIDENKCYICGNELSNAMNYATKKFEQDVVYPVCGNCTEKLSKISRITIADVNGKLFTRLWITSNRPWKLRKDTEELEPPTPVIKWKGGRPI